MKKFKFILIMFAGLMAYGNVHAEEFSFAAVSDIHKAQDSWLNVLNELKQQQPDLILVAGDMAPDFDRYTDFENSFYMASRQPVLLPVPGNHEIDDGVSNYNYMRDNILPQIKGIIRHDSTSCSYYYDYANARFIAVDGYVWSGSRGVINDTGRAWVEEAIKNSPEKIQHIFIFFHEPAYPQVRHVGDSFDEDPALRDKFWNMLAQYNKVRAVFAGHTHHYYRSEHQGIWQVSTGTVGNGPKTLFIMVRVNGADVAFQAIAASNGPDQPFDLIDSWVGANSLTTVQ